MKIANCTEGNAGRRGYFHDRSRICLEELLKLYTLLNFPYIIISTFLKEYFVICIGKYTVKADLLSPHLRKKLLTWIRAPRSLQEES